MIMGKNFFLKKKFTLVVSSKYIVAIFFSPKGTFQKLEVYADEMNHLGK